METLELKRLSSLTLVFKCDNRNRQAACKDAQGRSCKERVYYELLVVILWEHGISQWMPQARFKQKYNITQVNNKCRHSKQGSLIGSVVSITVKAPVVNIGLP